MSTYICKIKGDTNDADYEVSTFEFDNSLPVCEQGGAFFEQNEIYPGSPQKSRMEVTKALVEAIKLPRCNPKNRHNWSRTEYDGRKDAYETIRWLIVVLFGIDADDEKYYDNKIFNEDAIPDDLYEMVYEMIMDLLPHGECGIHTIVSVKTYPKPVTNSLYEQPPYNYDHPSNASIDDVNMLILNKDGISQIKGEIGPGLLQKWSRAARKFVQVEPGDNGMCGQIIWSKEDE